MQTCQIDSSGGCADVGDDEIKLGDNAQRVLRARYLKKDESGQCVETPAELFRRVAKCVADAERQHGGSEAVCSEWEDRFYRLMSSRRFMPNSPTLMNAGREMGMLSACFVLPVGDSIEEIFDSIKHTALIQKAGGGTGFAFDELRPTGDYISSSGGTTSGPISFWRAFSEATNAIQQGAFRRGANMGMMYIHHPDILKFLYAKEDLTQFTNYNISVKITDQWMEAFLRSPDEPHVVRNPRTKREYLLPKDLKIWEYTIGTLIPVEDAPEGNYYTRGDLWKIIVDHAWRTGEPGVVFMDRINQANPTPHIGRMEATNPCGEQPLLPYEACNLGSINLNLFITDSCTPEADVDWAALRETVHQSVRFLDNVIDVNKYPLEAIHDICTANRKIGLGIMGFADALFRLGVPYDSSKGVEWGRRFMRFLDDTAHEYSEGLAQERGCFPNWKGSIWDLRHGRAMRNATCTTVAPTGTISIIAGCSSGIEPLFSLVFHRNVLKGQDQGHGPMVEVNPIFDRLARARGFFGEGMMDRIATDGTLANIPGIPEDVRKVFVCANEVAPEWHVRMQAACQEHCDASISKTINFPASATHEDVELIYRMSYELRCKGVTVYRDQCRSGQPMARATTEEKDRPAGEPARQRPEPKANSTPATVTVNAQPSAPEAARPPSLQPAELLEIASSVRIRQITPFGNMHVQITVDPHTERELEVFAQLGKGGDLASSDLEAICRMVSLWLRSGGSLWHVIHQLKGIGSSLQVRTKEGKIMSLGDGLARALEKYDRAKCSVGLSNLLLGRFTLEELAKPKLAGNGNGHGKNGKHSTRPAGEPASQPADSATRSPFSGSRTAAASPSALDTTSRDLVGEGNDESVRHGFQAVQPSAPAVGADGPYLPLDAYKIVCPECRFPLHFVEGCSKCESCGWSQC
ncbi:MAG: adenosylcobalamin-dependent ribonucleoside-diphosphate reductase [Planctomycetes bacterium]|nr:adenosylcobalamin-dependent ribonucleoside-diphosphate reductase [Planctomycetota bacterium]